jgi:diguanylate cyclase (GGDEF)-like protein/PAS domain S-box-containing protein
MSALVTLATLGAAKLGIALAHSHTSISAISPAAGIALTVVLLCGYRMLPAVALGAVLAAISAGDPLLAAAGIAAGHVLATFCAVALLRRVDFRPALGRTRDVVALAAIAGVCGGAISATVAIGSLAAAGTLHGSELAGAWRVWGLSEVCGAVLVSSTLLVFACQPRLRTREAVELAAFSLALAAAGVLLLRFHHRFVYLLIPLLLLAALHGRQQAATLGGLIVSGIAVWSTARGHGPFAGGSADGDLARAQAFVIVGAAIALFVAAMRAERRAAETVAQQLADSERSLAEAQRLTRMGSFEHDLCTGATIWSDELYRILGVEPGEVNPQHESWWRFTHEDDRELFETVLAEAREQRGSWSFMHRIVRSDSTVRMIESRGRVEVDGSGLPVRMIGTAQDVTERKQADDALAHQASHDALTGLPNRALFLDRLGHALARARRSGSRIAVVFLDLDDFKLVNDTRGHDVGDLLLLALAPRLSAAVRPGDTVARFGGDEFVVLCDDLAGEDDAITIAQRMSDACSRPVTIRGYEHLVSVSAGVAMVRDAQSATADELLRDADAAMYRAKAGGKGRIEVFDEGMRARLVERIAVEDGLRRALDRGELRLHFQPIMSLRDSRIVGAEALLRWQHPERGLLQPEDFIAVAESSGLIVPIGEWVIGEACRQAAVWNDGTRREPIYVSVNLSPRQIVRSDVTASVRDSLRETRLDPELLEIEVTERALLENGEACARVLAELKRLGVRIVLDDFGTGYSSLSFLKRLTIDALKIDRSFVGGLGRDTEDGAIVSAVLSMAGALHVGVTAEGVETLAQLARLRAQGCEFGQGFLFSKPASADELGALLGPVQTRTLEGAGV